MKSFARWLLWIALAGVALQLFFVARIALMLVIAPESTAFMRSEIWRIAERRVEGKGSWQWGAEWVPYDKISPNLKRAVMASEDAGFTSHGGVDWDAIQAAWAKNEKRQQAAEKIDARRAERQAKLAAKRLSQGKEPVAPAATSKPAKVIGGSTITQQLAKNLLLSGERNLLRKGQELLLTLTLEALLSKQRILEIYLNSVEWGDGVFGAEAAAQRYFKKPASQLSAREAARLAVMLPSPKFFEIRQGSAYLARRTNIIAARMNDVGLP
ncbi:monofunctional biosynthetic peptidoglycan transglycosylase [Hydrogenophaga crassostreae]|uniref:Biosynthetic peptidoglycan transglycosylase n=1 Tax=Hydrogenophaga crassostreae TaxID=1763535 RepID=A0A167HMX0_9BURK|nr:transglycosylase domain-containing protein [Hydrogenophaga crassostreae]AOW14904.1 monofunctional biosynthetic peptidoglycan transglycosylase [Hydrogenophaga crassostreae]OAD41471.1 monofunctional biosynthetic peptidoglycan transglycosylase [Hydrogenophaga crassostreae]